MDSATVDSATVDSATVDTATVDTATVDTAAVDSPRPAATPSPPPRSAADLAGLVRRWRTGLLALAAVVALIGAALVLLGGGSSSDLALAKAINLQPSDLPGFAIQPANHSSDSTDAAVNARLKNCLGPLAIPNNGGVGADSPTFTSGSGLRMQSIQSHVDIMSSQARVASDFALAKNPRVWTCLSSALSGLTVTSNGVSVAFTNVHATPLAVSAPGTDLSFGVHIVMALSARGMSFPMAFDLLGYGVGRDELSVFAFALGGNTTAVEQQASAAMIARAVARPH